MWKLSICINSYEVGLRITHFTERGTEAKREAFWLKPKSRCYKALEESLVWVYPPNFRGANRSREGGHHLRLASWEVGESKWNPCLCDS